MAYGSSSTLWNLSAKLGVHSSFSYVTSSVMRRLTRSRSWPVAPSLSQSASGGASLPDTSTSCENLVLALASSDFSFISKLTNLPSGPSLPSLLGSSSQSRSSGSTSNIDLYTSRRPFAFFVLYVKDAFVSMPSNLRISSTRILSEASRKANSGGLISRIPDMRRPFLARRAESLYSHTRSRRSITMLKSETLAAMARTTEAIDSGPPSPIVSGLALRWYTRFPSSIMEISVSEQTTSYTSYLVRVRARIRVK
eukprot:scaffold75362_cov54-Phaeocystis_antarctica.AAC.4